MVTKEQLMNMGTEADLTHAVPQLHRYGKEGDAFVEKTEEVQPDEGFPHGLLVPRFPSTYAEDEHSSSAHFSSSPDIFNYVAAFDGELDRIVSMYKWTEEYAIRQEKMKRSLDRCAERSNGEYPLRTLHKITDLDYQLDAFADMCRMRDVPYLEGRKKIDELRSRVVNGTYADDEERDICVGQFDELMSGAVHHPLMAETAIQSKHFDDQETEVVTAYYLSLGLDTKTISNLLARDRVIQRS